jgi:hypothetical protein
MSGLTFRRQLQRGRLAAENCADGGARFTVELPMASAPRPDASQRVGAP